MSLISTKIYLGLPKEIEILHISDTHLTLADERDCVQKIELAKKRETLFPTSIDILNFVSKISKKRGVPILHTGDMIDFVSVANLEFAKNFNDSNDCFCVAGNHEFSLFVGEAKEDANYRNKSLKSVQRAFNNNIRQASRIINGVNFVALDNGYYKLEQEQVDFLINELKKGFPVVLLLHVPMYECSLYKIMMEKSPTAKLFGVPEMLMEGYPKECFIHQKTDKTTEEAIKCIYSSHDIKAIISGHLHFNYEVVVGAGISQIGTSNNDIRLIKFY